MRKLMSILLTLCLLCSMLISASAEQQTSVTVGPYTFDLPSNMSFGSQQRLSDDICVFTASGQTWMGNYQLNGATMQYDPSDLDSQGVMDYQNFYLLTGLLLGQEYISIMNPMDSYTDMPDGQALLMGSVNLSDGRVLYAFSHYYDGTGFMLILIGDAGTWTAACDMAKTVRKASANAGNSDDAKRVVISADSGKIHTIPSNNSQVIKTGYRGESFELVRENREWYAVMVDGSIGYIHKTLATLGTSVPMVVITADSGKIRTEASISGGLIKTAYKGETYELIKEITDWYIVDVNGRTGYIHKGVAAIQ